MFLQVRQCTRRRAKIATQKQENRCVLRDGAARIMMKRSLRTGSEGVKVDRRMRAFAWRGQVAKLLCRIVPSRVENGQSKGAYVVRSHNLSPLGMSVTDVNDENRMTELEGMTNVRMMKIVTRFHSSFVIRFSSFSIRGRTERNRNHSLSGAGVAGFKRVSSSPSWSRGLTGIARRISIGFLSCGWTGIAFLISGAGCAV